MGISKGDLPISKDVYIDYPLEEVMCRWDSKCQKIYIKFYGEEEQTKPVSHDNRLLNDVLRFGDEMIREEYLEGKS